MNEIIETVNKWCKKLSEKIPDRRYGGKLSDCKLWEKDRLCVCYDAEGNGVAVKQIREFKKKFGPNSIKPNGKINYNKVEL